MKFDTNEKDIQDLIGNLLMDSYSVIISIDKSTRQARTLYANDALWEKTMGNPYDFVEVLSTYVKNYSVDSDTTQLLSEVDLTHIAGKLRRKNRYSLFLTTRNSYGTLLLKEISFFQKADNTFICTVRDITERYNAVSKHMDKLEDALLMAGRELKDKSNFLNLMDHNIRTPLYSIMGLTRIVQDESTTTALDSYLHKISMSGTYMGETIDDILELRRIAKRRLVINPEPVRLGEFLSKTKQLIKAMANEKNLILSINTDEVSNLTVLADEHALYQVIMKLMQNAINYTVQGGRISLNTRKVLTRNKATSIEFSVESRGIVINQERLKVLFEQQDKILERIEDNIASIDIPLIIFKSYLLAMGTNAVTAESDECMGTKVAFTLSFPVLENMKEDKSPQPTSYMDFAGYRALIADDNTFNREVGEKILLSGGMDVVSAANGQEAVEIFLHEKGKFDVLIMDILMPVMDGLEAAQAIRSFDAVPNASTIPIIAMTADAFRENFEESLNAGMNAHIVKPLTPEKLFQAIANVIGPSDNRQPAE